MQIKDIKFITESHKIEQCPKQELPEYGFTGRSNVGKSSLINMLANKKKIARTSANPGKTKALFHYLVNDSWFLVDLPGYGYAKTSKTERFKFSGLIKSYALKRKSLACLFVLIDSRHKPQENDVDFLIWLGENQVPFSIIFTKADKLKSNELKKSISNYKESLMDYFETFPPMFITSSAKNKGREEVLKYIEQVNNDLKHV
jgi:GTP-binding protein